MAGSDPRVDLLRALGRPMGGSSDFDLNPGFKLPAGRVLRPAGVLIAVVMPSSSEMNGPQVVLTKRSSHLKHHPGQIAFPGGKVDAGDRDVTAAALREAHEEVGLAPEQVEVLGLLPAHQTVTGFSMSPVLAMVRGGFDPVAEAGEVDEVFLVPLRHLTDLARYRVETRDWLGQVRRYYAVPYGPYYIWGATARILRGLAERMQP